MKSSDASRFFKKLIKQFKDSPELVEQIQALEETLTKSWPPEDDIESTPQMPEKLDLPEEVKLGEVAIFSDGACRGNPGPGSWACMAQNDKAEIIFEASGVEVSTTNNIMELTGAIEGLEKAIEYFNEQIHGADTKTVRVYSDSKYVVEGMNSWVEGWKARGWRKADKKEPENLKLWQRLDSLRAKFWEVNFHWVRGHSGHPQNEYCDKMANQALDESGF